jgi:hypothetical protein
MDAPVCPEVPLDSWSGSFASYLNRERRHLTGSARVTLGEI